MPNLSEIERNANLVYSEYAFTKEGNYIRILNLRNPLNTLLIDEDSFIYESTMNGKEIDRVLVIYAQQKHHFKK